MEGWGPDHAQIIKKKLHNSCKKIFYPMLIQKKMDPKSMGPSLALSLSELGGCFSTYKE